MMKSISIAILICLGAILFSIGTTQYEPPIQEPRLEDMCNGMGGVFDPVEFRCSFENITVENKTTMMIKSINDNKEIYKLEFIK